MAMRFVQSRVVVPTPTRAWLTRTRFYGDGKGKVLSEEERAAENVYIKVRTPIRLLCSIGLGINFRVCFFLKKMERERLEKLKQKAAKESAENEKVIADKVACLQAQLMQVKAQVAHQNLMDTRTIESQWQGNVNGVTNFPSYPSYMNPISPQSSLDSIDHSSNDTMNYMQETQSSSRSEEFPFQACSKKRAYNSTELGELQELALRMMRN
ncbi:hypothetical protein ACLB2K_019661 [Fragaria x ananassa]